MEIDFEKMKQQVLLDLFVKTEKNHEMIENFKIVYRLKKITLRDFKRIFDSEIEKIAKEKKITFKQVIEKMYKELLEDKDEKMKMLFNQAFELVKKKIKSLFKALKDS